TTNDDQYKVLLGVATATTGNDNFYGKYILPAIPSFITIPLHQTQSNLLLIDNTLIIPQLNTETMQIISPVIGNLLVKNYFPTRFIKSYPKIKIMNKSEYAKFRVDDSNEKLVKIDE